MDERAERIIGWFAVPALVAAALVVPTIVIEQSAASHGWRLAAQILNWLIWSVFAAEVVVAMAVVEERWRWLREHPIEVAIVVLTPPFLPAGLQALRVLRLLRLLRLIELARLARKTFSLEGLRAAAFIAVLVILGGGAAFSAAEGRQLSTWDGIYWAVVTMTTVGYGDISPHTTLGRVISFGVMFVGIGFAAILTAALAERFVAHGQLKRAEEDLAEEIEIAEGELLHELQDVVKRLQQLELMVRRLEAARRG